MRSAQAGDAGAVRGRPGRVPAVWPGPVHAGNQKYPGGFGPSRGRRAALAGAPRNPSRQRRGFRFVPAPGARPRVPVSRRRARRPCPGHGNQVQPDTHIRSSAPDDLRRSAGRFGRLSAQSHPICVPQHADRHDAAIGADQRLCARVATGDRNACYRLAVGGLGWCYAAGRPRQAIAAGLLLSVVTVRWSGGVACCGPARCRPSRRAAARRQ